MVFISSISVCMYGYIVVEVWEIDDLQMKKGRIEVEVNDYSGTGANNHHDPKPPPGTF